MLFAQRPTNRIAMATREPQRCSRVVLVLPLGISENEGTRRVTPGAYPNDTPIPIGLPIAYIVRLSPRGSSIVSKRIIRLLDLYYI